MKMMFEELVGKILAELKAEKEFSEYKTVTNDYSLPPMKRIGIRTPIVRKIADKFFQTVKKQGIKDIDMILSYCERLLSERIIELRVIAFQWALKMKKKFQPKHFTVFEKWLQEYVTGWGSCDDLCVGNLGYFLFIYPEFIPNINKWTTSNNPMVRRAAAVSFIYSLRRGKYLEHIFPIADTLFYDDDRHVLQGYGWMLKEASNNFSEAIFEYVQSRKEDMPRVALRYAIEKLPPNLRKEAMKK